MAKWWIVFISVILLDQVSKVIAERFVPVVVNHGLSFGMFSLPITAILVFIILLGCFFFFARFKRTIPYAVSGLFLGGAVSNMIDRLFIGGVRDWMMVPLLGLRNNLADWAMVLAMMLLGVFALQTSLHRYRIMIE